jgi:hypothetical protein
MSEIKVEKIVLDRAGVRELLRSNEVMDEVKKHARGKIIKSFKGVQRCKVYAEGNINEYRNEN